MAMTIDSFAAKCRAALQAHPDTQGRTQVNELVKEVLKDPEFIATYIPEGGPERKVLYEDPDLGFTVLAHAYSDAKSSGPHDHGPTWAIYGQAAGATVMTDWDCVEPASAEHRGKAARRQDYTLAPGDAHLYEPGVVHSPRRDGPTRLLRIEGLNMDRVKRYPYDVVAA